jgi:hypothetical protein
MPGEPDTPAFPAADLGPVLLGLRPVPVHRPARLHASGPVDRVRRLLEHMDRYAVRFVVLEGERTWVDTRLSSFPVLKEVVARRRVGEYRFGHFVIIELGG